MFLKYSKDSWTLAFLFVWYWACVNIYIAHKMHSTLGKELRSRSHLFNANGLPTDIEFYAPAMKKWRGKVLDIRVFWICVICSLTLEATQPPTQLHLCAHVNCIRKLPAHKLNLPQVQRSRSHGWQEQETETTGVRGADGAGHLH